MAEQNFARRIREVVEQVAPNTFQIEWSGQSRQEKLTRNSVEEVLALSLIFAFLCLVALYESWKIPFAVMLSVPTGTKKIPVAVTFSPDQNISDLIKNLRDQVAHSREVVKMSYEKIAETYNFPNLPEFISTQQENGDKTFALQVDENSCCVTIGFQLTNSRK